MRLSPFGKPRQTVVATSVPKGHRTLLQSSNRCNPSLEVKKPESQKSSRAVSQISGRGGGYPKLYRATLIMVRFHELVWLLSSTNPRAGWRCRFQSFVGRAVRVGSAEERADSLSPLPPLSRSSTCARWTSSAPRAPLALTPVGIWVEVGHFVTSSLLLPCCPLFLSTFVNICRLRSGYGPICVVWVWVWGPRPYQCFVSKKSS